MKSRGNRPILVLGSVSNYISLVVNIAIGVALTPFIVRHVGAEGYGVWIFILSVTGYYGLVNLGVGAAVLRYVSVAVGKGDQERIRQVVNTAGAFFFVTGPLIIFCSVLFGRPLVSLFNIAPAHSNAFSQLIVIMSVAVAIGFIEALLLSVLKAHELFVQANVASLIRMVVRAAILVLLLQNNAGISGIGIATVAGNLASVIFCFVMVRAYSSLTFGLRSVSISLLPKLLRFGGITTVILVADHVRMSLDSIVIGKWVGMAQVGVYGVAFMLIRYGILLVSAAIDVLNPRFSILQGEGEKAAIHELFSMAIRISSFVSFGCCLCLLVFGKSFISLWVGPAFDASIPVLYVLAVPFAIALAQIPGIYLMYAAKQHHFYAIVTLSEALANLALSIALVGRFGVLGVALGTAIPMLVVKLIVQPIYVSRLVGMRLREYAGLCVPFGLLGLLFYAGAYSLGLGRVRFDSWGMLVLCALLLAGAYAACCMIALGRMQRHAIWDLLTNRQ